MKELFKQLLKIEERINYLLQIKDYSAWGNLDGFKKTCDLLKQTYTITPRRLSRRRSASSMNR
jgi:acetyl-CoA carboxylase carboxyl transferase subunit beta